LENNNVKFVPLLVTTDQAKIAFIKSLLDGEEIKYYIDNENVASTMGTPPEMTVMVLEEHFKLAEELLKDVR